MPNAIRVTEEEYSRLLKQAGVAEPRAEQVRAASTQGTSAREQLRRFLDESSEPPPDEGTRAGTVARELAAVRLGAQKAEAEAEAEEAGQEAAHQQLLRAVPQGVRDRVTGMVAPVRPAARWLAMRPTPGGLLGVSLILVILLFTIQPANANGDTRLMLIWRALTGGASIPHDAVGQQFDSENNPPDVLAGKTWAGFWKVVQGGQLGAGPTADYTPSVVAGGVLSPPYGVGGDPGMPPPPVDQWPWGQATWAD